MPLDLRPLTNQDALGKRGQTHVIGPESHARRSKKKRELVQLFDFSADPHCVRGERLGIVLGIDEVIGDCSRCGCAHEPGHTGFAGAVAHLTWSNGNGCFEARMDFVRGVEFGIVAEMARLCAEYVVFGDPCDPNLPCFNVAAGVGYGSCCFPVQLTERACFRAGHPALIDIPPFARSFAVVPLNDAVVTAAITAGCGTTRVPTRLCQPFFPNGFDTVELSTSSAASVRALIVFEIAL